MSLDVQQVEKQLLCDKAINDVNHYLDQCEENITLRGRNNLLMRGDYQNLLTYYLKILETIFLSTPIDLKNHCAYLQSFPGQENEYFKTVSVYALGLYQLLATVPSGVYEEVINDIKKTIPSK